MQNLSKMSEKFGNKILYSTCVVILSLVGFILSVIATVLPLWGYFKNAPALGLASGFPDSGHFGPWQICKDSVYGKPKCGEKVSKFQPKQAVHISGYFSIIGIIMFVILCILNTLFLAKLISKNRIIFNVEKLLTIRLFFSAFLEIISITVAVLFASQIDDKENVFFISRGESFYIQIGLIVISFFLFIFSLYDLIFIRLKNADSMKTLEIPPQKNFSPAIFNNPSSYIKTSLGYPISMTDNSAKPYASIEKEICSIASMDDILCLPPPSPTYLADVKGPLRSSLKKPKPLDELGISNPNFNQISPTQGCDTKKKVRIRTESTQV